MRCPACDQMILQPGFRYLNPKIRWYQFDKGAAYCPKCDAGLKLVTNAWFVAGNIAWVVCAVEGFNLLLVPQSHADRLHTPFIGGLLLCAAVLSYGFAMLNRGLIVVPVDKDGEPT